jgi:hypothetical protein
VFSFNGGVYLVWNVSGHITIRVTSTAGLNAVVSGLFFAPSIRVVAAAACCAPIRTTLTRTRPVILNTPPAG